jgi:hypothetical protein
MGRKLSVVVLVGLVLLSGAVVQAGSASAQTAPGPCELSADEVAGFPVIVLQHDLSCGSQQALPAAADGAFWLNLNGHTLSVAAGVDLDGTTPVVISNGQLQVLGPSLTIAHSVLWQIQEVPIPSFEFEKSIEYLGPAIADSTFLYTNLTVVPSGHAVSLERNLIYSGSLSVQDNSTTGLPVGNLALDMQGNVAFTSTVFVTADSIASGRIANNLVFAGRGLYVQAGAIAQLTVAGNEALFASGQGIAITGTGAAGVTDGGGNRDIWNLATGPLVPNCIGIVCTT